MDEERDTPPAWLQRLNLRFPGGRDHTPRGVAATRSMDDLKRIYKDKDNYIRSKYKGNRAGDQHQTSGIPIFGTSNPTERSGWSKGHNLFARELTRSLRTDGGSQQIGAENSHALGHGDLGVEHYLSAPPASEHQNTEQLAIELAMREAAKDLNTEHDDFLEDGQSMVRFKSTDVINPDTGALEARRIKLMRRKDPSKAWGGGNEFVAFDHLMDGRRKGITKDEAFGLGKSVYKALTSDDAVASPFKDGDRKGSGNVVAPTRGELSQHGVDLLKALRDSKKEKQGGNPFASVNDREGVNFIGPAFTDVSIKGGDRISGQNALSSTINQITQGKDAGYREAFKTTSGLPADEQTKLQRSLPGHLKTMQEHYQYFTQGLGDSPSDDQVRQRLASAKQGSHFHFTAFQEMVQARKSLAHKLASFKHLTGADYDIDPAYHNPQRDRVISALDLALPKRRAATRQYKNTTFVKQPDGTFKGKNTLFVKKPK